MRYFAVRAGPFRLAFALTDIVRVVDARTVAPVLADVLGASITRGTRVVFELAGVSGPVAGCDLVGVVDGDAVAPLPQTVHALVHARFPDLLQGIVETPQGAFFVVQPSGLATAVARYV